MLVVIQENEVLDLVEDGIIEVRAIDQTLEVEEVMILLQTKEAQEVQDGLEINGQEVMILNQVKEDHETLVTDGQEVMILNQVKEDQEVREDLEIRKLDLQVFQDLLETRIQKQAELVVQCQIQDLANIFSKEIVINNLLLLFLW